MKDSIRRIPLSTFEDGEYRKTDLSAYRYELLGLVAYEPMAGQGDVEHKWVYLCKNQGGEYVLITEEFDISVWDDDPSERGVSMDNLYKLTEEPLTGPEYAHCLESALPLEEGEICLPITLNLKKPPVPGRGRLRRDGGREKRRFWR